MVSKMIQTAWQAYKTYCYAEDELKPVTLQCRKWLGLRMTLVDSLSTLWLAGMHSEFEEAQSQLRGELRIPYETLDKDISFFEAVIRIVGGLVSVHDLSSSTEAMEEAIHVTNALQIAYMRSPSQQPFTVVNLYKKDAFLPRWSHGTFTLADISTVQVEHAAVSAYTQTPNFADNAHYTTLLLATSGGINDLPGVMVKPKVDIATDTQEQVFTTGDITLNAMGDSYYEYLLKTWIVTGKVNEIYRTIYVQKVNLQLKQMWFGDIFTDKEEQEDKLVLKLMKHKGLLDLYGTSANADKWGVLQGAETDTRPKLQKHTKVPFFNVTAILQLNADHADVDTYLSWVRVSNGVIIDDARPITGSFGSKRPYLVKKIDHQSCFIGGTLALGVYSGAVEGELAKEHQLYAKQATRTCAMAYIRSPTGLGPEEMPFQRAGHFESSMNREYHQRPETIESVYYQHRVTGNPVYREWGWHMASAIESFSKVRVVQNNSTVEKSMPDGLVVDESRQHTVVSKATPAKPVLGYSNQKDVLTGTRTDRQESFLLAETLKYMFLLFSEEGKSDVTSSIADPVFGYETKNDKHLDLNKWVFNTEAHPIRVRPYRMETTKKLPSIHQKRQLELEALGQTPGFFSTPLNLPEKHRGAYQEGLQEWFEDNKDEIEESRKKKPFDKIFSSLEVSTNKQYATNNNDILPNSKPRKIDLLQKYIRENRLDKARELLQQR